MGLFARQSCPDLFLSRQLNIGVGCAQPLPKNEIEIRSCEPDDAKSIALAGAFFGGATGLGFDF